MKENVLNKEEKKQFNEVIGLETLQQFRSEIENKELKDKIENLENKIQDLTTENACILKLYLLELNKKKS